MTLSKISSRLTPVIAPVGLIVFLCAACIAILGMRNAVAVSLIEGAPPAQSLANATLTNTALGETPDHGGTPPLVEMFLSQSCSSCVPAAHYVRALASRTNVVVLSWHVDYWDDLVVPRHGKWKDPYSDQAYTRRQRNYRINATTGGSIYTPQAVINGTAETVGSRQDKIDALIAEAATHRATASNVHLALERTGTRLMVEVAGAGDAYEIFLVAFHKQTQTSILGGENAGIDWNEANVVSAIRLIGPITDNTASVNITLATEEFGGNIGCAVIVQEPGLGAIIAAAYCPS